MIKITQNAASQNFVVSVALETSRETYQVATRVARTLAKQGVATVSVAKQGFVVEFTSYNDNITVDDVLDLVVSVIDNDAFIETKFQDNQILTNMHSSTITVNHRNCRAFWQNDMHYNLGGVKFIQFFERVGDIDTLRIDFSVSHESALQIAQDLQDLLDSLD